MRYSVSRRATGHHIVSAGQRAVPRTTRLVALLVACFAASSAGHAAQPDAWVKGRLLVQTRAGLADVELDKIVKVHGGKARRIGGSDLHIVDLPGNVSETAVLARLAHNPHLKFAELDGLVRPRATPNDPYLGSEWHLAKIGAPTAWDTAQGLGVTIAIVDTGVDATHPDLASRLVPGWNFYDNTADTSDAYNHGTGVAGTAAAIINNGVGVAGVAGQARIMPMRISDAAGTASWSAMSQALVYAADRGVRVANISYQVGWVSSVQSAAAYMKSKGGLVFVSAGNSGAEYVATPTDSLIVVGATTTTDTRASWSTFGSYVALSAPGAGIFTTTKGGGYVSESGTSFASPVAAGAALAVMSANPALTSTQVEQILFKTAVDLGTAGRDLYFGHGRVDMAAAVSMARTTPAADTEPPAVALTSPSASNTVSGLIAVGISVSDNVGVTRVVLTVNGTAVASDVVAPFGFSWDSTKTANGTATLGAVAYDAAGNIATATNLVVNVANNVVADTSPPVVRISNPVPGSVVSGTVSIIGSASDNSGTAGLKQTLFIDGRLVATALGGTLSYNWNTRKVISGPRQITLTAVDAAGNWSSQSMSVTR